MNMECNGKATKVEEPSAKVDIGLKVENVHSTEASSADVESVSLEDPSLNNGVTEATQSRLDKVPPVVSTTSAIKELQAEDFNINCNNVQGDKNKDIKSETSVNIEGGSGGGVKQLMNPSSVQQTTETLDPIKSDSEKTASKCHSLEEKPETTGEIVTNIVSERLIVDEIPSYSDGTKTTDAIVTHCTAALIGQSSVIDHINMVAEKQMTRKLSAELEKVEESSKGADEMGSAAEIADQVLESLVPEVEEQLKETVEKGIGASRVEQHVKEDVASKKDHQMEEKLKADLDEGIGHQTAGSSKMSVEDFKAGTTTGHKVEFYIGTDPLAVNTLEKEAENKDTDQQIGHSALDKDVIKAEVKDVKTDQEMENKLGKNVEDNVDYQIESKVVNFVKDTEVKVDNQAVNDLKCAAIKKNSSEVNDQSGIVNGKDPELEKKPEICLERKEEYKDGAMDVDGHSKEQCKLQLSAKDDHIGPCKSENLTEYVKLGLTDGNIEVQETTLHDAGKSAKTFTEKIDRKMSAVESDAVKETVEKVETTKSLESNKYKKEIDQSEKIFLKCTSPTDIIEDGNDDQKVKADKPNEMPLQTENGLEMVTKNGFQVENGIAGMKQDILDSNGVANEDKKMTNKHEFSNVDAVIITSQTEDGKSVISVEKKEKNDECIKPCSEIPGKLIADENFVNGRLESKPAPMPTAQKESIDSIKENKTKIKAETNKPSTSEEKGAEKENRATGTKNKIKEIKQKKDILHIGESAEIDEQKTRSEILEQKVVSESNEQKAVSESNEHKTVAESDEQKTVAESDEKKAVSECSEQKTVDESNEQKIVSATNGQETISENNAQKTVSETNEKLIVSATNGQKPVSEIEQKKISATNGQKTVSEIEQKTVSATNGQKTVSETNEQKTICETNEQKTVSETNEQKTVSETNEQKTVAETNEPKTVAEINEQKTVSVTNGQKTVAEVNEQKTVSPTNGQETNSESNEQKTVSESNGQKTISATNGQKTVSEIEQKTISATNGQKTISATNGQKTVSEIEQKTISATNGQKTVSETNEQKTVSETNEQKTVAETNEQKTVSVSNGQKTVAEVNEQKTVSPTNGQGTNSESNEQKTVSESNGQKTHLEMLEQKVSETNEQETVSGIFDQKVVETNTGPKSPVPEKMAEKLVLAGDDDEERQMENENGVKLDELPDYIEIQEKQIKKTETEETIFGENVVKAEDTEEDVNKREIQDTEIMEGKMEKSQQEDEKDTVQKTKTKDEKDKIKKQDGDHDSGVDESTQRKKTPPAAKETAAAPSSAKKTVSPTTAVASPAKTQKTPNTNTTSKSSTPTPSLQGKKLPMNKVVVGTSPSPNLKVVKSKIGSFDNVKHRAGGGQVKVETKKIDLANVKSRIGSTDNIEHKPTGGEKKILSRKLEWKAQSKIGSMENATHKPGGGHKKIEVQKLEFKDKAKPKVGSKDNLQHKPGGGELKIEEHKLKFKESAQSKVGSMDYVKHQPGGGNIQIFDEKFYHKQQRDSSKKSSLTNSDDHEHLSDNRTPSPLAVSPQPQQGASPLPPLNKEVSQTNGDSALLTGAH